MADNDFVLGLIKPFFKHEWANCEPQNVTINKLQGGFCNSVWLCKRVNCSKDDIDPESVIVKQKGGNVIDSATFKFNSVTVANVASFELSRLGLGPRIYGFFEDGTIEEFIPSHTLTKQEAADEQVSQSIAQTFAKIHSVSGLPLKVDTLDHMLDSSNLGHFYLKKLKLSQNDLVIAAKVDVQEILDLNYEMECNWLRNIIEAGNFRKNTILFDVNFQNCLVRDNNLSRGNNLSRDENLSSGDLSKVILIDYETIQYNLRGIDLGGHLFSRFEDCDQDKLLNENNLAIMRRFLSHYQNELKKTNFWADFDEKGIDSVENLLIESLVGKLLIALTFYRHAIDNYQSFLPNKVMMLHFIPNLLKKYHQIKSYIW